MKTISLFVVATVAAASCYAQNNDAIKSQMIADWQRAKAYTIEYLDAMPADKYGFKPQDSVRSFGQQMLHLAQGTIGLSANGTGAERINFGPGIEQRAGANTADSVRYYVVASYDYCIASLEKMNAATLFEQVKRGNFDFSRYAWLSKAFEHQTHHRGQTTIYIRTAGIKPPNEKLF